MLRFFLFPVFLLSLALVCRADSTELPVIRNATFGFNHQFPNRHWTPLRVDIENPGPDRHATIVVEPASRAQGQSISISKPVFLPAQSRRTIYLTVFPDASENAPITKPGQDKAESTSVIKVLTAKLTDGGLKVWSQYEILGKIIPDNAALMLVADARLTSYRTPSDLPAGWTRKPVAPVSVMPRDLPARAVDYESVSLLILGDPGPTDLNTMQRQAILDWVRAGGTLFLPVNPSWPAIAPVEFAPADKLATEPRLRRWGTPTVFEDGLTFRRMVVRDGTVLAGDTNSPLLAVRREGLGSVATFALDSGDLAFQRWTGTTNFSAELLSYALKTIPATDRLFERTASTDAIVSSLAGIKVLGRGPILIYLAVLAAGLIVVLYAFRLTRNPERGWPVVVILAVITGGAVVVAADRWKGQPQPFLNEVNVIYVAGEHAVAHSVLGLYSPRAAAFDLTASAETLRVRPRPGGDPFSVRVDDDLSMPGLAIRASDMRAMFGQAVLPDGQQPQARAVLSEAGLTVTVNNPTAQPLEDCFFKCNRLIAPLGDLPAGATKTFRNLAASDAFTTRVVANSTDELRTRIRRLFFPDPVYTLGKQRLGDNTNFRERGPAVYGWSDQPLFPVTIQQQIARRAVNFWNIGAPVTYAGRQLTVPRGLMTLRLKNKDARTVERAEGRYSGTRSSTILAEFTLPAECPDLQITSAKVFVNYRGSAFKCRVQIQSTDEKRHLPLTGETIPNPAQWYDPVTRSFLVAVDIEPLGLTEPTSVNYWQIRELDFELGGTVP
ncbi:MAG: hypothetical protein WCS70_00960 [Verrucomicrobiota bacterium]